MEHLQTKFSGECQLFAKGIINMRQNIRQEQKDGLPEIEAPLRAHQVDGAISRTKFSATANDTHLLVI